MSKLMIGEVEVFYNRSERSWQAVNGSVLGSYGTGDAARQAALEKALAHEFKPLHDLMTKLATKWPELAARGWKAATLVAGGHVLYRHSHEPERVQGRVKSQTGRHGYLVMVHENGGLACNCRDWLDGRAPLGPRQRRFCKHILALRLAWRLDWPDAEMVKRVSGGAHRGNRMSVQVNGNRVQVVDKKRFATGEFVKPEWVGAHEVYIERFGRSAANHEKLASWYIGR